MADLIDKQQAIDKILRHQKILIDRYGFTASEHTEGVKEGLQFAIGHISEIPVESHDIGITIKGVDMPKSCSDCPICYDMCLCSITQTRMDWANMDKKRLPDCPLSTAERNGEQND